MDDKVCKNCKYALARSPFSLRQFGDYHLSYECIYNQSAEQFSAEFKRLDDTCENFKKED